MEQLYQHQYIHLDKDVRDLLVSKFDIPRTGIREIVDGTVVSDGISNEDLKSLTEEKMEIYVGSHETFGHLIDLVTTKLKEELHPTVKIEVEPSLIDDAIEASEKERPYCGACVTHKGRHKLTCPNNGIKE